MGPPGPHHLQPPKYFWESSRNVLVFFTLRSHCETTCCPCQNWTPCPCPYEATQHLTECPDYHSVPHPHCAQARGGLCCDKENPAPATHTPHVSHSTTGPLLPHTEIFVETTLSVLSCPHLLESDMDPWDLGQRVICQRSGTRPQSELHFLLMTKAPFLRQGMCTP